MNFLIFLLNKFYFWLTLAIEMFSMANEKIALRDELPSMNFKKESRKSKVSSRPRSFALSFNRKER